MTAKRFPQLPLEKSNSLVKLTIAENLTVKIATLLYRKPMRAFPRTILSIAAAAACAISANAQSVTTNPVGFVNVDIAASADGSSQAITPFSMPLLTSATISGQVISTIGAVDTASITNNSGGWTDNLAQPGIPLYLKINTGAAAGRIFLITSNTTTTLTVDTTGLPSSGLSGLSIQSGANGDTYEIIQAPTLLGLFGAPSNTAPSVVGGSSQDFAAYKTDKVILNDAFGAAKVFYYNTTNNFWMKQGSQANQNNVPVSPQAGMLYYRVGTTPLLFTFSGKVPTTSSQMQVPDTGTTVLSSYFPSTSSLSQLSLNSISGWKNYVSGVNDLSSSDRVAMQDSTGAIRSYYYDASPGVNYWKRVGGQSIKQDATVVNPGTAVYCTRFGGTGTSQSWTNQIPYSL